MSTPADAGAPLVGDLGERQLIARIRHALPPPPPSLMIGPGDDAAVVVPERGAFQVLTTDALVEGVHFDLRWSSPADVGYKALAVNVSDIAAMGATPSVALLSLMLPESSSVQIVDGLLEGFLELARAARVTLAGGNVTRTPGPLCVDVTLVGYARPRKVLTRGGARPGDRLYVSGTIGSAAAGLACLRANAGPVAPGGDLEECVARHRRPEPRARLGALLGRTRAASACMDLSDGLADAVRQIAEASGTGARIDAARVPVHPGARRWFEQTNADPLGPALMSSDDYELLFAVSPRFRGRLRAAIRLARGLPVTEIGVLTEAGPAVLIRDGMDERLPAGFSHF